MVRARDIRIVAGPAGVIHDVPSTTETVDGTVSPYDVVQPGDTLRLESGTRGRLVLRNLVGTPSRPITVTDDGGTVDIVGAGLGQFAALDIRDACKHLRIVGSNQQVGAGFSAANQQARIVCSNANRGISPRFAEGVEYIELGYIEVKNTTDNPGVHSGEGVRANFPVLHSIWVHHLYIHDVPGAEGLYIGDSAWGPEALSSEVDGVVVEWCLVEDTGYDGLQFGSAAYDTTVPGGRSRQGFFNNVVRRTGLDAVADLITAHDRGITSQGGNVRCDVLNNWVEDAGGPGIRTNGLSEHVIANNVVVRWSRERVGDDGIDVRAGDGDQSGVHVVHNTLVDGPNFAVDPSPRTGSGNTIRNNIAAGSASGFDTGGGWTVSSNLADSIANVGFVDDTTGDYHLTAGSAAVGAGVDLSAISQVAADFDGVSRPQGGTWDQGAYEHVS